MARSPRKVLVCWLVLVAWNDQKKAIIVSEIYPTVKREDKATLDLAEK